MARPGSVAVVTTSTDPTGTGRWLRLGQHTLLAVLVLVCGGRSIADGAHPVAELAALAAFVGWYAVGPRLARAGRGGTAWFVGLVVLWGLLVLVSPENVWLAFPLWLLAGHVLPLLPAVLISLAVLVVVALEPVRHTGEASYAAMIGPCIGMVVALGVAKAQQALVRDGIERQRLIASLYAAQEESGAHRRAGPRPARRRREQRAHPPLPRHPRRHRAGIFVDRPARPRGPHGGGPAAGA